MDGHNHELLILVLCVAQAQKVILKHEKREF